MKAKYLLLTLAAALFSLSSCDLIQPEKGPVIKLSIHPDTPKDRLTFWVDIKSLSPNERMWIDLNGDGFMQNEEKWHPISSTRVTASTPTVNIHGMVYELTLDEAPLISLDATGNPHLKTLTLYGNNSGLGSIDLSQNNNLQTIDIRDTRHLTTLKLSLEAGNLSVVRLRDCFHLSDKQLLEIAKIVPNRTGKEAGRWLFNARQPKQEVIALFEQKNWIRER